MKYELLEPIGMGGMATVHRARMRGVAGFERIVALKRIRPELAVEADYVARFIREARIASALAHANIVQVIELGKDARSHYMAMEYLEGWSLLRVGAAAHAANIEMPLNVIVSLLSDLLGALDHVHTRRDREGRPLGIVHRDISHGNLFVTKSGHLKLIDFGIATATIGVECDKEWEVSGKPSYMAPEAIRGQPCDGRTDVFSAGVVAWEMLTGRRLFGGRDDKETMRAVLHQKVLAPSGYRTDCPLLLDVIVRDALAKDIERRTVSAAAMRDQLDLFTQVAELDVRPSAVAQWIEAEGLFDGPFVDVEPNPTTLLDPPVSLANAA
jgi:serine/threonine-protein kinase